MKIAASRITQQGQISVPAEVRRRLGLVPGSEIVWEAEGDTIVIRRAGKFTSEEIHQAAFPEKRSRPVSVEEMDAAIAAHIRKRHARR